MTITPRQAFKFAFLRRCAESGIGPDEAQSLAANSVEKTAAGWAAGKAEGLLKGLAGMTLPWAKGLYFGTPLLAGGLVGASLAKAQDMADEDPAEVRTQESIDAYHRLAEQMQMQRRLRDRRLLSQTRGLRL